MHGGCVLGPAIADILPIAAAVALFPIPILVVILLLFSKRATGNALVFLVGWLAGLTAIVLVGALLTGGYESAVDDAGDDGVDLVRILLGVVVLLFAAKKWLGRPTGDGDPEMPGWMSAIADAGPARAAGFGLLLTALNPKNIALGLAASTAVGQSELTVSEAVIVFGVFLVVASLGVGLPVLYHMVAGQRARTQLDLLRAWLIANNAVVMTILMLLIGVVLISQGIRGY